MKRDPTKAEFKKAFEEATSTNNLAALLGIDYRRVQKLAAGWGVDLDFKKQRKMYEHEQALSDADMLKHLLAKGYDLHKEHEPTTKVRHIQPEFEGKELEFGIVSDTHLGSKYQQLTFLDAAYAYMRDRGITTVLHAGDLTAGIKMYRGQEYEIFQHGGDAQREYAIDVYPWHDGITTYIIAGNHDMSHQKHGGYNIVKAVCEARPDMEYLGVSGAPITLGTIPIYMMHPSGGVTYARSYRMQKMIEQFNPQQKPKMFICGHYHVTCVLEMYRNVYGIMNGCFESQTPYLIEKGLYPELGYSIVKIVYDKDGAVRFVKEFVPFYVPNERDY